MLYTHKLLFDLKEQKPRQRIPVAYGSGETILVELSILDGGVDWSIPDGTACVIRYMKANGNGGVYHVMADGSNAWNVEDNRATIILIGDVLNVPGLVDISVALVNNGRTLCIHGFDIHVDSNLLMPLEETEDVLNVKNLSEINTAFAALQMKTDTDSTLSINGRPADAAAAGSAISKLADEKADISRIRTAIGSVYFGTNTTAVIPLATSRGAVLLALTINNPTEITTGLYYIAYHRNFETDLAVTKIAGSFEPGLELTEEGLTVTCGVNWSCGFYITTPNNTF